MKFTLFSVCILLIIITAIMLHSYKGYDKGVFRTLLTFSINAYFRLFSNKKTHCILNAVCNFIITPFELGYKSVLEKFN